MVETVGDERESWVSQIRKGVLELAVLALLSSEELYGVEIVNRLALQRDLSVSAGTLYPMLSRLKKTGLVDSVWRESPVGPPRKYYRLTESGGLELTRMTEAWRTVSASLDELLGEGGSR